RYGAGQRCDDFLSFADTYNQDFLQLQRKEPMRTFGGDNELKAHENQFNLPELEKLNDARQEVARYVKHACTHLSRGGTQELILGEDFLTAVFAHMPHTLGAM